MNSPYWYLQGTKTTFHTLHCTQASHCVSGVNKASAGSTPVSISYRNIVAALPILHIGFHIFCPSSSWWCHWKRAEQNATEQTNRLKTRWFQWNWKPKKPNSLKPWDKRSISLLNCDFKILTGIESLRLGATAMHTLSQSQFVARENRRIHHGIGLARDAIYRAGENNTPCGI